MIQPIKHFAVNWVDGMKISQKHFGAQEDCFLDTIRDSTSLGLNQFNYGLLPIKESTAGHSIFEIYNSATNDVQLIIKQCHALTPAGYRIAISDLSVNVNALSSFNNTTSDKITEERFYILVSVNPFDRVPSGEFDPEETPPRHISSQPKYHIELVEASSLSNGRSGGNYIVAGRIIFKTGLVNADLTFIPPCTSIHSHPTLLYYYNEFSKKIAGIQQFALRIIQKNIFKNQNAALTESIKSLCNIMLHQFANSYFYYRNQVHHQPPINLVNIFAQLAHSLYNSIEIVDPKEKEEMLNYCYEWSDVSPHLLLNHLSAVVEINYDHNSTGDYMLLIQSLLQHLYNITEKLSGLEYIGQHKENIVVKEEAITQVIKDKKGWSVLD